MWTTKACKQDHIRLRHMPMTLEVRLPGGKRTMMVRKQEAFSNARQASLRLKAQSKQEKHLAEPRRSIGSAGVFWGLADSAGLSEIR
ncbi:hypothetical protein [Paenibacillus protaetiae]|uniref:Uncharacterized protein n=1 Tax=Paenibacillus protaetiae TaxID=2509456 RepID=A0A4P6EX24_9BACL|nr:hypothetical protein [Paenibacillus protaetiae]QAY67195.1 hypothetical protein ET464_13085 [Paenibacillus protaetiae]